MHYLLLIHVMIAIWILIDGHKRKINVIPWALGTIILGPIILPYYLATYPLKPQESRGRGKSRIYFKVLAVFWVLMLAAIGIWGGKIPPSIIGNEPLEYRLAVINSGRYVREDDAIVSRFRSLLDQLSQNYIEDPQQIANMSMIICKKMKAYDIDESLLNIMEGMNQLLWPQDSKKKRYSEYAYAYASLRNKGLAHNDAIERLQATVSGY